METAWQRCALSPRSVHPDSSHGTAGDGTNAPVGGHPGHSCSPPIGPPHNPIIVVGRTPLGVRPIEVWWARHRVRRRAPGGHPGCSFSNDSRRFRGPPLRRYIHGNHVVQRWRLDAAHIQLAGDDIRDEPRSIFLDQLNLALCFGSCAVYAPRRSLNVSCYCRLFTERRNRKVDLSQALPIEPIAIADDAS